MILVNKLRAIVNRFRGSDSLFKKILLYPLYVIRHPLRFLYLFFVIKKCNPKVGVYRIDTRFLKYGKLNFEKQEHPKVSIIIPVYNQLDYTYKCLRSILKNITDVTYEIIIGDDVSNDGTAFLDTYVKNITVVHNKENYRFLRNCNNAAKYAKGEYIVFLNNDTLVHEKWLSSLVDLLERDQTIGMVGSKFVYPNGKLQEAGGIIFQDGSAENYGKFLNPNEPEFNYVRDVGYISGASIMLSMKLWKEIGGFDKNFVPAYCEDSDLAFEVRKRGLRVVYQPKSVVVHFEGVSNGVNVSDTNSVKHYQVVNNQKLKDKWHKELKDMTPKYINPMNIKYRDLIHGRKVILVIDQYVPEFDKDAGSKTTYQYLKMFTEKGYLVKFLPDNFAYNHPYTEALQQMGIEVLYGLQYAKYKFHWIYENRDNIDFVYLNRPEIAEKYIDFLRDYTNIKVIYYGHDLHFLREKRRYELSGDKQLLELSKEFEKREFAIMKKVDAAYYPSNVEKEIIQKKDPSIYVKAINAYIFDDVDANQEIDFENKQDIMFIGGFSHTPNVDGVLWFAQEIFPKIYEELGINFYVVGSHPPTEVKQLEKIPGIIVKGYVTDEELNEIYEHCKMSVIPLRYGAGIKGKVVESMSQGIPFVTTSCGAEGIVGIEKILPIVDESEEFADQVIALYKDNKKLSELSKKERNYIRNNFSTEAAFKIIEEDFK